MKQYLSLQFILGVVILGTIPPIFFLNIIKPIPFWLLATITISMMVVGLFLTYPREPKQEVKV